MASLCVFLTAKTYSLIEPQPAGISIDLAGVVDEGVTAEQLVQRLKSAGSEASLCDIRLFD